MRKLQGNRSVAQEDGSHHRKAAQALSSGIPRHSHTWKSLDSLAGHTVGSRPGKRPGSARLITARSQGSGFGHGHPAPSAIGADTLMEMPTMRPAVLFPILLLAFVAATAGGCAAPAVGDPCTPEAVPMGGFVPSEAYLET